VELETSAQILEISLLTDRVFLLSSVRLLMVLWRSYCFWRVIANSEMHQGMDEIMASMNCRSVMSSSEVRWIDSQMCRSSSRCRLTLDSLLHWRVNSLEMDLASMMMLETLKLARSCSRNLGVDSIVR